MTNTATAKLGHWNGGDLNSGHSYLITTVSPSYIVTTEIEIGSQKPSKEGLGLWIFVWIHSRTLYPLWSWRLIWQLSRIWQPSGSTRSIIQDLKRVHGIKDNFHLGDEDLSNGVQLEINAVVFGVKPGVFGQNRKSGTVNSSDGPVNEIHRCARLSSFARCLLNF